MAGVDASVMTVVGQLNRLRNRHRKKRKSREDTPSEGHELSEHDKQILEKIREKGHLSKKQSGRKCPECSQPFTTIKVENTELEYCVRCGGTWFDSGELKHFTHKAKDVPSENLKSRKSEYNCPVCNSLMKESVYMRPHNLLVDKCPEDHGVYLERGELERVFKIS